MEDRRRAKRQKLDSVPRLLHLGNLSNTGLGALLGELRRSSLDPASVSRDDISDAFHSRFDDMSVVTPMAVLDYAEPFRWELLNPGRLISTMVSELPALAAAYSSALAKHPCSIDAPWDAIFVFDELSPGNKLKVDNSRKCLNISISFKQLSTSILCNDWAWHSFASVRSQMTHRCVGGTSAFIKEAMKLLMLDPHFGLAVAGIPIVAGDATCMVFARLSIFMSDGDGLRDALNWRGASSMKPCWLHTNMVKKNSGLDVLVAVVHTVQLTFVRRCAHRS